MTNRPQPTGTCWCGCGGETGPGSFVIPNHDRIAEAKVVRSEYGSIAGLLAAHGYGPGGKDPVQSSGGQDDEGVQAAWQEMEEDLGFKKLTAENWLEPDSIMRAFARWSLETGAIYLPTAEERARDIIGIELKESVPVEVRRLFAAAKGALCYGYFFYPLYALASEQLLRVAEAAVARKYEAVDGPKRVRRTPDSKPSRATFEDKLKYLEDKGVIHGPDAIWWGSIREQRNSASHPEDYRPQIPGYAVGRAAELAKHVNSFFET